MQDDFTVELGSDDPALELPWTSPDPHVRYYDLKVHPELVQQIPEVVAHPELGSFLSRINAHGFPLATAKCDVWSSDEVAPEEEIFGDRKFMSYIDLMFVDDADRCSFEKHEAFARELCRLLAHVPEMAATAEFVIRRCYYHQAELACENKLDQSDRQFHQSVDSETSALRPFDLGDTVQLENAPCGDNAIASISGFCLTAYVTGFGDGEHDPVLPWTIGLSLLQHVLVQLTRIAD